MTVRRFAGGGRGCTLQPMHPARLLYLVLLLAAPALGAAGGGSLPRAAAVLPQQSGPAIGAPRQSLPVPVHDEATCGFCQAAIFPPCTPAGVSVPADLPGLVREPRLSHDARIPHSTARRLASSRAPPTLRAA